DPGPLISTIGKILAEDSSEATNIAQTWLEVSLCDRDFDSAFRALALLPIAGWQQETSPFPPAGCEGVVARLRGDDAGSHAAFSRARGEAAKLVAAQSDYAEALRVLGMVDA